MKNPRVSRRKEILKIRAAAAAAAAVSLQLCLTLCNPIDGSPPDCPIPGILQARVLEWVAIAFSTLILRRRQIKTTTTHHLTPIRMAIINRTRNNRTR